MSAIEDGSGKGFRAKVTRLLELSIRGVSRSEAAELIITDGLVWTIPFDVVDPTAEDDYFLYISNTGSTNLAITRIQVSSTVAGTLELQKVTGTSVGGSAVTLVNRKLGSANVPSSATIESAVDITGLTDAGVLEFIELVADTGRNINLTDDPVIISPNTAAALLWTVATGILTGNVTLAELVAT
ncbi:MAG: hypothetical protein V3W09_04125 [Nitrososphaerales archaeon]